MRKYYVEYEEDDESNDEENEVERTEETEYLVGPRVVMESSSVDLPLYSSSFTVHLPSVLRCLGKASQAHEVEHLEGCLQGPGSHGAVQGWERSEGCRER